MEKKKYNISVEATLEVIGGKWKCVILCHLTHGKKRTSDLRRLMPSITQKMLTQQLRELEEDGIVNRLIYHQVPPKVEYELTQYGWSLKPILDSLCMWGENHIIKEYGDKFAVLEDNILNNKDIGLTTEMEQSSKEQEHTSSKT
ncbi:winged helix-turn-helix transcriptional regulator [Paenibacillus motobuensis]|uniref:winged helix-turn-helix transcriptional regulator n=1 Tax=Paenibacillus TaxID=44249 RepID=UPI002040BE65|nr:MULTISPECIES: winged helix-turn-helix transcriptional regulator [Paenibacillus]MCM3038464.1 winged helix-turn-helix transcriptional regulator [Paenibacillus lutimineralis]MCM3645568.1 winged helix-turn-helix transcriptional regulator [Paenibacillus motobuensis]